VRVYALTLGDEPLDGYVVVHSAVAERGVDLALQAVGQDPLEALHHLPGGDRDRRRIRPIRCRVGRLPPAAAPHGAPAPAATTGPPPAPPPPRSGAATSCGCVAAARGVRSSKTLVRMVTTRFAGAGEARFAETGAGEIRGGGVGIAADEEVAQSPNPRG
jgi:hypothetical protein